MSTIFYLTEVSIVYSFLLWFILFVFAIKICHKDFPLFASRSLLIWDFLFRSMIYLLLIFVQSVCDRV